MTAPGPTPDDVDAFLTGLLARDDEVLAAAVRDSEVGGLPSIAVSGTEGKLLFLLARAIGARRVLEIGTLGGYSAIWLARGLAPGGRLVTLEYDPHHAAVARANLVRAGFAETAEVRVGRALDTLPALEAEEPFDLVFIDADEQPYPEYLEWALRLTHPGALIIADNVVRPLGAERGDEPLNEIAGLVSPPRLEGRKPRGRATGASGRRPG